MYYLGIDIGSLSCDAVIVDENKNIVSSAVVPTGAINIEAIKNVTANVLEKVNLSEKQLKATVSTGYGRERVKNRLSAVTEITCHAKGVKSLIPNARLVIDIGGQDSKAILLNNEGKVTDFAMNDKCAAGTGRFLEAMAKALQVNISELSQLDRGAEGNTTLSSMCTVFAESEVVSLIARGIEVKEIVKGLNNAIASRNLALIKRICPNPNEICIAMSGGVANNSGVVRALNEVLSVQIKVPQNPDTIGALGAALIALEKS